MRAVFPLQGQRSNTSLRSAVLDGLIPKNPAEALELPKRTRKEIDPFTLDEANMIIAQMYRHEHWPSTIYAAFFEFAFFTGMQLSEALALRRDAVDEQKKQVHVCRTVALGKIEERTKTGSERLVLLNDRALHALKFAREYAERRKRRRQGHLHPVRVPPVEEQRVRKTDL